MSPGRVAEAARAFRWCYGPEMVFAKRLKCDNGKEC